MVGWLKQLDGLVWLLLMLGPFLFFQRRLHLEIQSVFLLLTRRPPITLGLFSILFLPGVFLHEMSHFLMALLLGVRTGRFSILPQMLADGRLRMGYVETETADFLRDALIGIAPLVSGGLAVAGIGLYPLALGVLAAPLFSLNLGQTLQMLAALPARPDFWLWFYLAFAISSTMLPSASDRRGWLPLALAIAVLIAIAIFAGAGPWMLANLAPRFNGFLKALAGVFAISLATHLALLLPVALLHRLLSRLTGLKVG